MGKQTIYWISWKIRENGDLRERSFLSMTERELFAAMLGHGDVIIVERWEK